MIETPHIVALAAQPVAALHINIPRAEMRHVIGPAIHEAMAAAQAQGLGPTGPWFAHHHKITAERFDFDVCVPVSAPVTATGRVKPWTRPAFDVVRTVYQGPYEGLCDAWQAFNDWIAANSVNAAWDVYERYLLGPESTADAAQYRTELSRPIVPTTRA